MNLGAGAWWLFHPPAKAAEFRANLPDVPGLTLLAEVEDRGEVPLAELNAAPEALSETPVCMNLGPFDTPQALRQAIDLLGPMVSRLQYREAQIEALKGYRVYLPATETRDEALASARRLSAMGIRDLYVVSAGEDENSIALGLYRDKQNAERRVEQIAALGIRAELASSTEPRPQWWLEIAVAEGFDWSAAMGEAGAQLQAQNIPCL